MSAAHYHAEPQHLTVEEACAVADAGLAASAECGPRCPHGVLLSLGCGKCDPTLIRQAAAVATGE
jgi:hypothetical protein